ncbi:MAG: DNA mismatch repair protein MutS [Candidatus Poseidoniia archaeon]|jgi:DNA mismatch repair protein MutS|nr:DNA mismatch repair protein MutS [Candidatus Poseidoniia archaeon]MDP7474188.1 DNA mismatch repair protein MutS [Candidatus Poseidoniia archaeon]HJO28625.1 DNA mismatch repair protein MutS [Candidatus Poseidoniia archaeon]
MMKQYYSIKREHPDALLMFRMGDFYETFGEDARTVSRELDIVLTARDRKSKNPVPLAGIPYHALDSYLAKLIRRGYRVAICDQLENPKAARGLVKRGVTRVVSPGTVVEGALLDAGHNFLAAVLESDGSFGLALLDISTGDFRAAQFARRSGLEAELVRHAPAEVLVAPAGEAEDGLAEWLRAHGFAVTEAELEGWLHPVAMKALEKRFGALELEPLATTAAGAVLEYASATQFSELQHLRPPIELAASEQMVLDAVTLRNLEVVRAVGDGGVRDSLFGHLNTTVTAGGGRTLREWLLRPICTLEPLAARHGAVGELVNKTLPRREIRDILKGFQDVERLLSRVGHGSASPRDLAGLGQSLSIVGELQQLLQEEPLEAELLASTTSDIDPHPEVSKHLAQALVEEPPQVIRDGGIFRAGFSSKLDQLRGQATQGREWVTALQAQERKQTGIARLKVGYNRVFGYYLEIPKKDAKKVPESYHRKQTVATGERYITPELKEQESAILHADERATALESELFHELRDWVLKRLPSLQSTARAVGQLDALAALSEVAETRDYCQPEMSETGALHVSDGRHPVIERLREGEYIPNSLHLDDTQRQVMILTGPNMGGKSTYMRQTALICLLAQAGSWVPAASARLPLVDRIFTRVGAHDDLVHGHSTFMVEMLELANILQNATPRSLVLLDEIGRGTSTYDGLAIAWAVAEQLHAGQGVKTMFATHYHQLTDLARLLDRTFNSHMQAREEGHELLLLYRVAEGAADASFGVHVAQMAGVPDAVTARAREVLGKLEQDATVEVATASGPVQAVFDLAQAAAAEQKEDPLRNEIRKLDLMNLTPLQALEKLHELQQELL